MTNLSFLPDDIRSEFRVDADGQVFTTYRGLARLCGINHTSISRLLERIKSGGALDGSEALEKLAALGIEGGALSDVKASCILEYYALDAGRNCTEQAKKVYRSFAAIGYRVFFQRYLGWQPEANWQTARFEGKATRRSLTDAVKSYMSKHIQEMSANDVRWLYLNASQLIDIVVFGRKAKKLAEDLQVPRDKLRDALTSQELLLLREVEDVAARMIDQLDVHPVEAVKRAGKSLLIPVQTRKLISTSEA